MDSLALLLKWEGGTVALPARALNDREDGGHLLVNPPHQVWERSALSASDLTLWSFLVAATGQAMLETLPQLSDGCINYWEAGNWALNDQAEPVGPKDVMTHRRVHLHVLGRGRRASSLDWAWGESPRFPSFTNFRAASSVPALLTPAECRKIVERIKSLLIHKYGAADSW